MDFFLLRTPRMPLATLQDLYSLSSNEDLDAYLRMTMHDEGILDAIFLASSGLHEEVEYYIQNRIPFPEKIQLTLYKYFLRMASRSTPFGLFAGIAHGKIAREHTEMTTSGVLRPSTRFDMRFSTSVVNELLADDKQLGYLDFATNSSIHELDDHYRFFCCQEIEGQRECNWIRVKRNVLLDNIIQSARKAIRFDDLVDIVRAYDIDQQRARAFVTKLIRGQLLVSNLEPTITGEDHFERVHKILSQEKLKNHITTDCKRLHAILINTNRGRTPLYQSATMATAVVGQRGNVSVFQTDSTIEMTRNLLQREIVDTIVKEVIELLPLNARKPPMQLLEFRDRFVERYGEAEIPFMTAIDQDRGIGYNNRGLQYVRENPLLQDLAMLPKTEQNVNNLCCKAIVEKGDAVSPLAKREVELSEEDLANTVGVYRATHDIPDQTAYALGSLYGPRGNAELDRHNFIYQLVACGGPSATPLMARFGHLDKELEQSLQQAAGLEQGCHPDEVVAEIIHLPHARIANVVQRPVLRDYEIPLLGNASVSSEYQIPLSDLMVSVVDGEVLLRSKRLNKVVRPRLSSAHNYQTGMTAYRFLCDIKEQHALKFFWDWGVMKNRAFLPRVSYKHLILARAQWNIPKNILADMKGLDDCKTVSEIATQFNLDRQFVIAENDNELPIDIGNPISRKLFLQALRKQDLLLYESLSTQFTSPVHDASGSVYNNELVIPFSIKGSCRIPSKTKLDTAENHVTRRFPPGSEWIYAKLYCGEKDADDLLAHYLPDMMVSLKQRLSVKKWFFVRYYDNGHHLRVRFLLHDEAESAVLTTWLNGVLRKWLDKGLLLNFQYDTYFREIERYGGGRTVEHCESVFHAHSEFILNMLSSANENQHPDARWRCAMLGVDRMLDAFGLSVHQKLLVVDSWKLSMIGEFEHGAELRKRMDAKYRAMKQQLDELLIDNPIFVDKLTAPINAIKQHFSEREIADVTSAFGKLLFSLNHMNVNRTFYANQRENELVIYHLLGKHYFSAAKRADNMPKTENPRNTSSAYDFKRAV